MEVPVVEERLPLGLEDRTVLVGRDRPDLEPVRQLDRWQRHELGTAHEEEVADQLETGLVEERAVAGFLILGEPADLATGADRLEGQAFIGSADVLGEEGPADALAAVRRDDVAADLEDARVRCA